MTVPAPAALSRLVAECTSAAPIGGEAIAEALIALVRVLIRRAAGAVPQDHAAQVELMQDALERLRFGRSGDPYLLWSPAIATIRRHLAANEGAAAATQLAYLLRDAGGVELPRLPRPSEPVTLYTGGRYIRIGGADTERVPDEDAAGKGPGSAEGTSCSVSPISFPWGGSDTKFLLPTRETIIDKADVEILWPAPMDHDVPQEILALAAERLGQAAEWIRSVSPAHFDWITRLIRGFAVTIMPEGSELSSGSYITRPGIVHISFPLDMLLVAETLIHEASHQHYLVMNSVVRLVDPAASASVFSPIKGMPRPIDRTLFAYHACFNIWDFFRRVDDSPLIQEASERGQMMYDYATSISRSMSDVDGLTPTGSSLSSDLRRRLSVSLQSA